MNSTVIHVPHASVFIPEEYRISFDSRKLSHEIGVMTDWFCDELFDCGRIIISPPVSRLVCDMERFRNDTDEIMASVGMGAVYTACSDLLPLRTVSKEDREHILREFYDPHHSCFGNTVAEKLKLFGECLIIDGHSFYPLPLPYELDQSPVRPDFYIGTSDFHTSEKTVTAVVDFLKNQGFSVKVNAPFSGTIVPMEYYGNDPRVESIMIEVNRKLYLDAPGVKSDRFEKIRKILSELVSVIE